MGYVAAKTLKEAFMALDGAPMSVIAGGTDWYPALGERPAPDNILNISGIKELRGITHDAGIWRIGATTCWSDLYAMELPACFDGLILAARELGSIQIQNAATIAGNLCNASPAADGVPPLLVLDAEVELASRDGSRILPLAEFVTGVRQTALMPGELVTAVLIPDNDLKTSFLKLGARRYLVISIAVISVALALVDGKITDLRIAVGSCAPFAKRLPEMETRLIGLRLSDISEADIEDTLLAPLTPIDDIRATASYRLSAVKALILRAIRAAA